MTPVIERHRAEIATLCRRYHVKRLDLFGSAARGEDRPDRSDLDFLVAFDARATDAYAESYFGLLEELEKLFGRPVDLVVDEAIRNPYLRQGIERSMAAIYAA